MVVALVVLASIVVTMLCLSHLFSPLFHDDDDAGWCHHIVTDNGRAYLSCYSLRKEKRSNNNKLYYYLFFLVKKK